MTAAAEAVREGGATVLVLEQQDIIGGETLYEPVLTLSDGTLTSGYGMLGDLRAEVEEAGAELLSRCEAHRAGGHRWTGDRSAGREC